MSLPKPPTTLSKAGKLFWKKVIADFDLEPHHMEILKQACLCLDDLNLAEAALKEHGRYFKDRYDQWKEHPAAGDAKQLRGLFQRLVRELGLDVNVPESRPPRYGG